MINPHRYMGPTTRVGAIVILIVCMGLSRISQGAHCQAATSCTTGIFFPAVLLVTTAQPGEEEEEDDSGINLNDLDSTLDSDDLEKDESSDGQSNNPISDLIDQEKAAPSISDEYYEGEQDIYDIVYKQFGKGDVSQPIKSLPLIEWWDPQNPKNIYAIKKYSKKKKQTKTNWIKGTEINDVSYFEERALEKVCHTLGVRPIVLQSGTSIPYPSDPSRQKQWQQAKQSLMHALNEHNAYIQLGHRQGAKFAELRSNTLLLPLLSFELTEVEHLIRNGQFSEAERLCEKLESVIGKTHKSRFTDIYEKIFLPRAEDAFNRGDYGQAREMTRAFLEKGEDNARSAKLQKKMQNKIEALFHLVKSSSDNESRLRILRQIELLNPYHHQILDEIAKAEDDFEVLRCAFINEMPENFCPLIAHRSIDRLANSLMFESLVRWSVHPEIGHLYTNEITEGLPVPVEMGRDFRLRRDRFWSGSGLNDKRRVTAKDVRRSHALMSEYHPPGYAPVWEDHFEDIDTEQNDPFELQVILKTDHWHPLALMTFPILPEHCFSHNSEELEKQIIKFNTNPEGTGPYKLRDDNLDKESVRFNINPFFQPRPSIEEVRFYSMDPDDAFRSLIRGMQSDDLDEGIDMFYGIRPKQITQINRQLKDRIRLQTLKTQTVYFLAPNYERTGKHLQNLNLRKAIAYAINRNKILNDTFRAKLPGTDQPQHEPLYGIFPAASWAHNSKNMEFDSRRAAAFIQTAKREIGSSFPRKLILVYPDDDQIEEACRTISDQVAQIGLNIEMKVIPKHEYPHFVTKVRNFDLAYWHYDYLDETYWCEPLFDSRNHSVNIMQHINKPEFADLFSNMRTHKQFREVRKYAREVDAYVSENLPVIPLWRLDTFVAISKKVDFGKNKSLDPIHPFGDIENWRFR